MRANHDSRVLKLKRLYDKHCIIWTEGGIQNLTNRQLDAEIERLS